MFSKSASSIPSTSIGSISIAQEDCIELEKGDAGISVVLASEGNLSSRERGSGDAEDVIAEDADGDEDGRSEGNKGGVDDVLDRRRFKLSTLANKFGENED